MLKAFDRDTFWPRQTFLGDNYQDNNHHSIIYDLCSWDYKFVVGAVSNLFRDGFFYVHKVDFRFQISDFRFQISGKFCINLQFLGLLGLFKAFHFNRNQMSLNEMLNRV